MKKLGWPLLLITTVIALVAAYVCFKFWFGSTAFVADWGLQDPSVGETMAGLYFGRGISLFFLLGLIWLIPLCYFGVIKEEPGHDKVKRQWDIEGQRLKDNKTTPDEAIDALLSSVEPSTRIWAALKSWRDPSPNSDPEYIIEGKAVPYRQSLGIVQTLASVLVLVGLVGNFFGLAEAVRVLPNLPGAVAAPGSQELSTTKNIVPEDVTKGLDPKLAEQGVKIEKLTEKGVTQTTSTAPDSSALSAEVRKISDGLGVVVISSVMGIGSMAVLLILGALLKAVFNSVIADEVVLLSTEIGTAVRPAGGGAGFSPELQAGLTALPDKLASFESSATRMVENLGKYGNDFGHVSSSLQKLLDHQLKDATEAYKTYHETLNTFSKHMVDERGSVIQLMKTTNELCTGLEKIAKSVEAVAEHSENVGDRLNAIQLQYEAYLQAAKQDIEKSRAAIDRLQQQVSVGAGELQRHQLVELEKALSTLTQRLSDKASETFDRIREALTSALAEQTAEQHKAQLDALKQMGEGSLALSREQLDAFLQLRESQTSLQNAFREGMERQAEGIAGFTEAAATLKEARQALTDNRDKLVEVYDRLSHQQEVALRELIAGWQNVLADKTLKSAEVESEPLRVPGLAILTEEIKALEKTLGDLKESFQTPASPGEVSFSKDSLAELTERLAHGLSTVTVAAASNGAGEKPSVAQIVAPDEAALERYLTPLLSEVRRVSESLQETQKTLRSLPELIIQGKPSPGPVSTPEIETGPCDQCGRMNRPGAIHCADCGHSLRSGPTDPLNALVRQLIRAIEQQPGPMNLQGLERVVQAGGDMTRESAERLLAVLDGLPAQIRLAIAPDLERLANAIGQLSRAAASQPRPTRYFEQAGVAPTAPPHQPPPVVEATVSPPVIVSTPAPLVEPAQVPSEDPVMVADATPKVEPAGEMPESKGADEKSVPQGFRAWLNRLGRKKD